MLSVQDQKPNPKDGDGWKDTIRAELARLNGVQHERKKKDTLIAIIDANMAGKSEETVWGREDTCARSTWHDKWKKDPLISDVLERARRLAHDWRDGLAASTLAQAAELLALESYASVEKAAQLRDGSDDDRVQLQAAFGILDRAGALTAAKSDVSTNRLDSDQFAALRAEAQQEASELEAEALDAWTPDAS